MDTQIRRVTDPADPGRCKAASQTGQCMNRADEGSDYCAAHGSKGSALREATRQYHLTNARWQASLNHFRDQDALLSLRDEIAINRTMLQHRLNLIKDDTDFLLHAPEVQRTLIAIKDLVKAFYQMEQSLGVLLARDQVVQAGQAIVEILGRKLKHIPNHTELIREIREEIGAAIMRAAKTNTVTANKMLGGTA